MSKKADFALTMVMVVTALAMLAFKGVDYYRQLPPLRYGAKIQVAGVDLTNATLLVFTAPNCPWCAKSEEQWKTIFPRIQTIALVPSARAARDTEYLAGLPVEFRDASSAVPEATGTPTLVLVKRSRVVAVWSGYSPDRAQYIAATIEREK